MPLKNPNRKYPIAIGLLGLWLLGTSLTFGGSFGAWMSELCTAPLLIFLATLSFCIQLQIFFKWSICIIGVWLQFSPLLFWAKDAFTYLNDTFTGILVIAFSLLLTDSSIEKTHAAYAVPKGWSYNPSGWSQRFPIAFLAFFSWMCARYLAAYQLGYVHEMWDPVFGQGTERVITSSLSRGFPISDAGLGAFAYTLETLMALHGSVQRWHTMPWFVILFAILVIPLGIVSIILIILQPIVVGFWCFWCLLIALCMLLMVAFAVDEAVAVIQYVRQKIAQGDHFWDLFWKGGDAATAPKKSLSGVYWLKGISFPWNLIVSVFLGGWFMFCSPLFHLTQNIADQEHIIGAMIITVSIISMAEVVRTGRLLLVPLGIWILITSGFVSGFALINHLGIGIFTILLCIPRGKIKEHYGLTII